MNPESRSALSQHPSFTLRVLPPTKPHSTPRYEFRADPAFAEKNRLATELVEKRQARTASRRLEPTKDDSSATAVCDDNDQLRKDLIQRFDSLLAQCSADPSPYAQRRIQDTRKYFMNLVAQGTPDYLINSWSDGIWNDSIVSGMSADLVRTYWGEPLKRERDPQEGGPTELWTYQLQHGRPVIVLMRDHVVAKVSTR